MTHDLLKSMLGSTVISRWLRDAQQQIRQWNSLIGLIETN